MTALAGADGVTLSIKEWPGDTRRSVLAVHATGFCKEAWEPVASRLSDAGVRVVAFDQRGHGSSSPPPATAEWWGLGRDALAVAEAAGPIAVGLGHSSGGTALTMVDLLAPGLVPRLVLIEPVVFPADAPYDPALADGARRRRATFADRDDARRHFEGRGIFAGWVDAALDGYLTGGLREEHEQWRLSCEPVLEAEFYELGTQHGVWERLGEVTADTTLIAGGDSSYQEASLTRRLARRYAAALRVVAGAGHFLPMQKPEVVVDAVLEALG